MLNSSGYTAYPDVEKVENHESHADGDRRIGNIERPEVPVAPVDVDEIDDVAGAKPVDQVASRAADDQCQADACEELSGREGRRVDGEGQQRHRRDDRQQHRLERKVRGVQQSEGRAIIVHPSQVEQAGNNLDAVVQLEARSDKRLGRLVERHDRAGYPELELEAPRDDHPFTVSASASTQRSQMPAQSGSVLTAATNRQHRSHFTPGAFSTSTRTSSAPSVKPTRKSISETMKRAGSSCR